MTKHLFSGDGIWPIINPPLTDFVWELCAKWPFISSAQTELRKIVELKPYLINDETFSSWGTSWNWEFYRRRQIQWLMHPRHLPLTNWNRGSQRKKERFSILSRIDCWHWSLTSPYRMDLELLTKSVKHLTSWFQTIELGFGQFPLFPWVSGSKLSIVLFFLTNHMLTSIPWQRSDCHMFAVDSVN